MKKFKFGITFYLVCLIVTIFLNLHAALHAEESPAVTTTTTDLSATLQELSKLTPGEKKTLLAGMGLDQAGSLDLWKIFGYILFGGVGVVAFIYGKKNASWRPMIIGIILNIYPYFFSATWMIYLIGIVLTAALFFWRE